MEHNKFIKHKLIECVCPVHGSRCTLLHSYGTEQQQLSMFVQF